MVLLEVVPQLPRSKEHSISYLLVLRVTLLGLCQDLAYIVNWSFKSVLMPWFFPLYLDDDVDYLVGGLHVN